jgi:DNA-directed RNA polymerase subunit RPC12/RpoP
MKCLACGAGLEYVQNVTFARCSHCLQLFTVKNNGPHQRWIEPLGVVGGGKQQPPFARGGNRRQAVNSIETELDIYVEKRAASH